MQQLSGLDAAFLTLDSPTAYGHVGSVCTLDRLTELVESRLHLVPPFRRRLAEVPLGLDQPYWIEDPDFDIEFHVRELALPAPGDDRQLATQAARLHARPLDRARPLWELYLIHGLQGGQVALLTKIHHAVIDGASGAEILGVLLDLSPEGRALPKPTEDGAEREPGELEMLSRGLLGVPRYPLRVLRALPSIVPNLEDVPVLGALPGAKRLGRLAARAQRALGGEHPVLETIELRAPHTSFNGRVSPHRRFAFGQLSLDAVKQVKNAHGCTVN